MKRFVAAITVMALMLVTLCACGGEESPFEMETQKGDNGYTCYGFKNNEALSESIVIPATYNGEAVTAVGDEAFEKQSGLHKVAISEGIERIGDDAFSECVNLQSITLPQTLTDIDFSAFYGCSSLKEIWLPENVDRIAVNAFTDCAALERIVIEGPVEYIEAYAFQGCTSLEVVWLPETITLINDKAFDGCNQLREIHFAGTAEEFLDIEFGLSWMTAENVLVCCSDNNIFYENRFFEDYTDRDGIWPHDPNEDWSDPGPDETMPDSADNDHSYPDAVDSNEFSANVPSGYVEFEPLDPGSPADQFAYAISKCDFDTAGQYLNPTLLTALDGDVTNHISSATMGIFGNNIIGWDPESYLIYDCNSLEMTLWGVRMDDIRETYEDLNTSIDFEDKTILAYYYNFGTLVENKQYDAYDVKLATLLVYTDGKSVLDFSYICTN